MEYQVGRLIDHVHLRVADLEASKRFYRAVLSAIGRDINGEADGYFMADELFVTPADGDPPSCVHLAFQTATREEVHRFHEAALAIGARDNGAPGERGYHPGYYGAFALDPDGNNIEAVHHGPTTRSAPSIVVSDGP